MLNVLFIITYLLTDLTLVWLLPGVSIFRAAVGSFIFNGIAWFPAFATFCAIRANDDERNETDDD